MSAEYNSTNNIYMEKNICIDLKKALAAFVVPFLLCPALAGCRDAVEFPDDELPAIEPLPQPEIPDDDPIQNYDEEEILNHVKSDFAWWDAVRPRKRQELSFERGTKFVKLCSDSKYIYGCIGIDRTKILSRNGVVSPDYINNLAVWLDTDDVREGQGGGWFMSATTKGFDMMLRGKCADSAVPVDWKPSLYDVHNGGDNFGETYEAGADWKNAGVGTGRLEGDIFMYTFTVDRVRLGIDAIDEIALGISFDQAGFMDYVVIPDRAGFNLRLSKTDEIEYDLEGTEEPAPETIDGCLKSDPAFWAGIEESGRGTDTQFERGTRCVKFSSDADYVYGYVEVDLDKVYERNTTVSRPEYLNFLGIWLDTDDIHEGQGGGWALSGSPKSYDILLYGQCASGGTPQAWTPEVRNVAKNADNFGSDHADAASYEDFAAGSGDVVDGIFCYTFVISRKSFGLEDMDELSLAITFNKNSKEYNDWMVVPARCGFTVPLGK